MINIRNQRQKEFSEKWLESERRSIIYAAPRTGKIRISILCFDGYPKDANILICYPDNKIRKSWEEDFEKWGYSNPNVEFSTYLSLGKHIKKYDLVVLDEIHTLSEKQISVCKELLQLNRDVLGLTGTLGSYTRKTLKYKLSLDVLIEYSIQQAIDEGILPDYRITVHKVPLDNVIFKSFGKKRKTEYGRMRNLMWLVGNEKEDEEPSFFVRLKIIEVLKNSISKVSKTKALIKEYNEERLLVFTGFIKIADNLGIPSYHSKTSEEQIFNDFAEGKFNHLAVINIGTSGVTYKPLSRVIVNYFSSDPEDMAQKILRCMSWEYDNPEKLAKIDVITSNEKIELRWLNKALEFFDKNKIEYI